MRRFAVVLVMVSLVVLVPDPAFAVGPAVLTTGTVGGADVAVNDVLKADLKTMVQAKFTTMSGGASGVFCPTSTITVKVLTNPPAGGAATGSVTAWTYDTCTSNIPGAIKVLGVAADNLPYGITINGATGTVAVTSMPISISAAIMTGPGPITCTYQAVNNALTATAANADNSVTFTNQRYTKTAGNAPCPPSVWFSASYAPLIDTNAANAAVFLQ
jgi:hypothetical protein